MQRGLNTFPIPMGICTKLHLAGFDVVEDLNNFSSTDLCRIIGVTRQQAVDLLRLFLPEKFDNSAEFVEKKNKSSQKAFDVSLYDFLRDESCQKPISCNSEKFDDVLGGGIPISKITEICGGPGTGKTQICLQLCVNVQISKFPDGLSGEALYIDTEGSFNIGRLIDIANACIQKSPTNQSDGKPITVESILNGIHFYRCRHYTELIAIINQLPELMTKHPQIRLIIIDTIAFPFQVQFDGKLNVRLRVLSELAQNLMRIATTNKLAVVLTNQMTTKIPNAGSSYLIPALGETWGHAATLRVILFWENNKRHVTLPKSPSREESTAEFQITVDGIRDIGKDENRKRHISNEDLQASKILKL